MTDREITELITALARIDSINPSLSPGGAGEAEIARHVVDWSEAAGLRTVVFEETAGRPSVVIRGGRGRGRSLMLCGHLDTVAAGGMEDPLTPRIEGARLYGRGVYDMKAGLAAAMIACRDAVAAGIEGEVIVAAVADEEHSSLGVQEVLRHVRADAAIVTEPTELAVATAHKGFVWTRIEIIGKAAHGSRPHLGVDAILRTGPVLVALDELNRRLRATQHPTLGPGTLHASLIDGGTEESTIPGLCTLTVERRTLPGESVADVERDVEALLAGCRAEDPELVAHAVTTLAREPFEVPSEIEIAGTLLTAGATGVAGVSYWADSAFIAAAGIPTVLYGPRGDGAHADVEWVDLPSAAACARTLTGTALAFCR